MDMTENNLVFVELTLFKNSPKTTKKWQNVYGENTKRGFICYGLFFLPYCMSSINIVRLTCCSVGNMLVFEHI